METSISRGEKEKNTEKKASPSWPFRFPLDRQKGKRKHEKRRKFELFPGNPIMGNLHYSFFCTASCLFREPGPLNSRGERGRYHLIFRQSVFPLFQFSLLSPSPVGRCLNGKEEEEVTLTKSFHARRLLPPASSSPSRENHRFPKNKQRIYTDFKYSFASTLTRMSPF